MSEDRTQAPTRRRWQMARERGMAARSPELTAAVGLLAAVVLIGAWGGDLASALVRLVREPLESGPASAGDPAGPLAVASSVRHAAASVAMPLGTIALGVVAAMVVAHAVQTGGLWAPVLLAPDLRRLVSGLSGGQSRGFFRGLWNLARAGLILAVGAWAIRDDLPALDRLDGLDPHALARASWALLKGFAYAMGLALLALGIIDFALAYRRLEALLRLTPEEHREEQKAIDGDPEVRARRIRLARSWLRDPTDALAGSALLLTAPAGLAVLLGGSPPPGRVSVRLVARGATAASLRRAAARARLPRVEAPGLARWFADPQARAGGTSLPAELASELASLWPPRNEATAAG